MELCEDKKPEPGLVESGMKSRPESRMFVFEPQLMRKLSCGVNANEDMKSRESNKYGIMSFVVIFFEVRRMCV